MSVKHSGKKPAGDSGFVGGSEEWVEPPAPPVIGAVGGAMPLLRLSSRRLLQVHKGENLYKFPCYNHSNLLGKNPDSPTNHNTQKKKLRPQPNHAKELNLEEQTNVQEENLPEHREEQDEVEETIEEVEINHLKAHQDRASIRWNGRKRKNFRSRKFQG